LKEFIKDYGTLIIAVYGVIQVWIIAMYKKFFRRGKLSIYHSGKIELEHSNFGPTMALNGTIVAIERDVFVSNILLNVRRIQDNAHHIFYWTIFRPPVINLKNPELLTLELPSGFIVKPDSPHRYNIVFSDRIVQEELAPVLTALQQEWSQFLTDNQLHIEGLVKTGETYQSALEKMFNADFSKTSKSSPQAWDFLRRKVFWEPSEYVATMDVFTDRPVRIFKDEWGFSVDAVSFENLRLNAVATIRETCLRNAQYNFAYLDYKNVG
jgi:hypothetical protein